MCVWYVRGAFLTDSLAGQLAETAGDDGDILGPKGHYHHPHGHNPFAH